MSVLRVRLPAHDLLAGGLNTPQAQRNDDAAGLGNGQKDAGRYQAAAGVTPAQQSLQPIDVATHRVLGLVMQLEQAKAQRFAQLLLHAHAVGCLQALLRLEEVQPALLPITQTVHGGFCLMQQLGRRARMRAKQRGADIDFQRQRLLAQQIAGVQALLQALAHSLDQQVRQIGVW